MKADQPSRTAEAVAFWRALEQLRPPSQRILDDPYAEKMLSRPVQRFLRTQRRPEPLAFVDETMGAGTMVYTLLRHRWMEESLARAGGNWEQVLILGAGYDMRAFRLAERFAGARVLEIDHPATGGRKIRKVQRMGLSDGVERIAVDFAAEDLRHALARAGFQPGRRSWFFWEGVSMYLPRVAVETTLGVLREHGCEGVLDFFGHESQSGGIRGAWMRFLPQVVSMIGEPVDFRLAPEEAEAFLGPLGYEIREVAGRQELASGSPRPVKPHPEGWGVRVAPRP